MDKEQINKLYLGSTSLIALLLIVLVGNMFSAIVGDVVGESLETSEGNVIHLDTPYVIGEIEGAETDSFYISNSGDSISFKGGAMKLVVKDGPVFDLDSHGGEVMVQKASDLFGNDYRIFIDGANYEVIGATEITNYNLEPGSLGIAKSTRGDFGIYYEKNKIAEANDIDSADVLVDKGLIVKYFGKEKYFVPSKYAFIGGRTLLELPHPAIVINTPTGIFRSVSFTPTGSTAPLRYEFKDGIATLYPTKMIIDTRFSKSLEFPFDNEINIAWDKILDVNGEPLQIRASKPLRIIQESFLASLSSENLKSLLREYKRNFVFLLGHDNELTKLIPLKNYLGAELPLRSEGLYLGELAISEKELRAQFKSTFLSPMSGKGYKVVPLYVPKKLPEIVGLEHLKLERDKETLTFKKENEPNKVKVLQIPSR